MNKFAVIKTGGKQYLVKQGDILRIEKINGKVDKKITFKNVFLALDSSKNKVDIGQPRLKLSVEAEIIAQERGKKVTIIKYKPKTRYHKKRGHRQLYTRVKILNIGKSLVKTKKAEPVVQKKTTVTKKQKTIKK